MFLNTMKTMEGYTNEVTQILSFFTGKRIVMNKNKVLHVAYTNERVGEIKVSPIGKVTKISLEHDYEEHLLDVSFLFRADHLVHGENKGDFKLDDKNTYEKLGGFIVLKEQEYAKMAKEGVITSLLGRFAVHGVLIKKDKGISVSYDYGSQSSYYDNSVMISDGLVRLTPTNTKPTSKFIKKFTAKDVYLCILDLAYVENVGCVFAPVGNEDVCRELLNAQSEPVVFGTHDVVSETVSGATAASSNGLNKLSIFGR